MSRAFAGVGGDAVHLAAGSAYQTRRYPNSATYVTIEGEHITVFPMRFEDRPRETWTVDPSLFPEEPNYEKSFVIPRLAARAPPPRDASSGGRWAGFLWGSYQGKATTRSASSTVSIEELSARL